MKKLWQRLGLLAVVVVGVPPVMAEGPGPVNIKLFQFQPGVTEVRAGTRVTWSNQDDIEHTVTSGTPEKSDNRFNARLSGKGEMFGFTFIEAGTYPYFCNRHQSMRGEVRVK